MVQLNAEQQSAVDLFLTTPLLVIEGGPGTGKTTVIKELVVPGEQTLLCAPTGNAAQRLAKSTDRTAYTIDSILWSFSLCDRYKYANVIVDEASMVNLNTIEFLLEKLRPKRLVLVGDVRQLPCQQGSSVLPNLLAVPSVQRVRLVQNHRQAVSALQRMLVTMGTPAFRRETDANIEWMAFTSMDQVVKKATELFNQADRNAQILAFTNKLCQDLNHRTARSGSETGSETDPVVVIQPGITVGDRVVCTSNLKHKDGSILVANGCIGIVKTSRQINYANGFKDTLKKATGQFRSAFAPARAITVHKSQGNEFDVVGIVVIGGYPDPPLELLYTAMSRFKQKLYIVGVGREVDELFAKRFYASLNPEFIAEYSL
jgi:exodeoxyribonuclease V alpha subunit